jgi:hypothetical protein
MKSPATRTYQKRSFTVMASYFVIFSGTFYFVYRVHPVGWELYACAALPFLPLLIVFMLTAAYLKAERDDFKRDLMMRCLLWGAGASMSLNLFMGFLRIFGWHGQLPPFGELFAFCLAVIAAKITYRVASPLPVE